MLKTEKILKMVKWISVTPGINAPTLAKVVGISERSIYRYLQQLQELGIPIKSNHSGYTVEPFDIMKVIRLTEHDAPESDEEAPESAEDVLRGEDVPFLPDIPEHLPYTPGGVAVTIGMGSMANVSYMCNGGVYTDQIHLEQMNTLQVNLAAGGVKLEAIDPYRGIGSVVVRWK